MSSYGNRCFPGSELNWQLNDLLIRNGHRGFDIRNQSIWWNCKSGKNGKKIKPSSVKLNEFFASKSDKKAKITVANKLLRKLKVSPKANEQQFKHLENFLPNYIFLKSALKINPELDVHESMNVELKYMSSDRLQKKIDALGSSGNLFSVIFLITALGAIVLSINSKSIDRDSSALCVFSGTVLLVNYLMGKYLVEKKRRVWC